MLSQIRLYNVRISDNYFITHDIKFVFSPAGGPNKIYNLWPLALLFPQTEVQHVQGPTTEGGNEFVEYSQSKLERLPSGND